MRGTPLGLLQFHLTQSPFLATSFIMDSTLGFLSPPVYQRLTNQMWSLVETGSALLYGRQIQGKLKKFEYDACVCIRLCMNNFCLPKTIRVSGKKPQRTVIPWGNFDQQSLFFFFLAVIL